MASSKWKSIEEISELAKQSNIYFWGASNWIERTLEDQTIDNIRSIIDENKNNWGESYFGFGIISPDEFFSSFDSANDFIIISTASYPTVIDHLSQRGLIVGEHFCCAPPLSERADVEKLKNFSERILVSSPMHRFDERSGGGIYLLSPETMSTEKVYSGKCRGIYRGSNKLYLIDMLKGLVTLSDHFVEESVIALLPKSEPHGITIDEKQQLAFVAQPGRDSVGIYSLESQQLVQEISISNKWQHNQLDNHHVNDLFIDDDTIYISMFSKSGNWPLEVYDGGIAQINRKSAEIDFIDLTPDAWMPHGVKRLGGKMVYLDSMKGLLVEQSHIHHGEFQGFIRGLSFKNGVYGIGCSQHRYPEKLTAQGKIALLTAGVYYYDPKTHLVKFQQMTEIDSIHDVAFW